MTAVLLSLLTAVSYGLGDFVGGATSKRTSPWAVALVAQVAGTLLVLLLTLVTDGSATSADLAWAVAAGVGNGFGTAFLYRGLARGRMGVVAPISGVGSVVVPVAVALLGGERPGGLVWVGIVAALPAIWLVSREPAAEPSLGATAPRTSGVLDGVLAGLGFGSMFAALSQVPEAAGFLPLAVNQAVAGVVIVGAALVLRQPCLPRQPVAAFGALSGTLGALATGSFLLATQSGQLTVTAVIASLYPAFTVLLAAGVLRERIHPGQAAGLLLCGVAVGLVAAG